MGLGKGEESGARATDSANGSVRLEQSIAAPADRVAAYVSDFRNSTEWMVGVESVEPLGEGEYRLRLETPVGKLDPGVRITGRGERGMSWIYTTTIEGGGEVEVRPSGGSDGGCTILYAGEFRLKRRLLGRAAQLAGMERFARRNGERSLTRLKALMEAGRY